jgi:hypothetical protein
MRFYLNFLNPESIGQIEIKEPTGFDGSTFTIEQVKDRFARDVTFGSEEMSLRFTRTYGSKGDPVQLPSGIPSDYLTSGFEYLIDALNVSGFESEVEFILEVDGSPFTVGLIDFATAKTDRDIYFEAKVIQETTRALVKRREDVVLNAFSGESLDNEPIQPCQTVNILLKAKPLSVTSEWFLPQTATQNIGGTGGIFITRFNFINGVRANGVRNTLSYLQGTGNRDQFVYIEAIDDLTNVFLSLKLKFTAVESRSNQFGFSVLTLRYYIGETITNTTLGSTIIVGKSFENTDQAPLIVDDTFTFTGLNIPSGHRLWIWFEATVDTQNTPYFLSVFLQEAEIRVDAISTAIDSVIKGVRLIDIMRHSARSVANLPMTAPDFELGGEHFNNFAFNGKLIRQFTDEPFNYKLKDLMQSVTDEVCSDYQVNPNEIEVLTYDKFYENIEVAVLPTLPNDSYNETFNTEKLLNTFEFKYKNYEKDRDESNTIDAVHTETQWLLSNKQVESKKDISIDHIRDPFNIESTRRQGVSAKPTTSLNDDDKLFIIDCVELPPSARGGFFAKVTHQVGTGNLLRLSNLTPNNETQPFNWGLLGFSVGSNFNILEGQNVGNYTVTEIEPTVLTLEKIGTPPTFNGVAVTRVDYPLNNVQFVNRTNQGFTLIEGLASGDNYSNLRYTPKRNINRWLKWLGSAVSYSGTPEIKNTYFKNGGNVTTILLGNEATENADIDNIRQSRIVDPVLVDVSLVATFNDMVDLLERVQTDKGFIRAYTPEGKVIKGYPKQLKYTWATGLLDVTMEKKYEAETVVVENNGIINGIQYFDVSFQINSIFVQLFDDKDRPIINPTRFDLIVINGQTYDDIVEFTDALTDGL